mmetsp:Transcript_24828/g.58203  ORF Transcript_24828/g.58203 Transcript_24828/m.58203 type:complete len:316 (+) Transcript_24828:1561-2508(+)
MDPRPVSSTRTSSRPSTSPPFLRVASSPRRRAPTRPTRDLPPARVSSSTICGASPPATAGTGPASRRGSLSTACATPSSWPLCPPPRPPRSSATTRPPSPSPPTCTTAVSSPVSSPSSTSTCSVSSLPVASGLSRSATRSSPTVDPSRTCVRSPSPSRTCSRPSGRSLRGPSSTWPPTAVPLSASPSPSTSTSPSPPLPSSPRCTSTHGSWDLRPVCTTSAPARRPMPSSSPSTRSSLPRTERPERRRRPIPRHPRPLARVSLDFRPSVERRSVSTAAHKVLGVSKSAQLYQLRTQRLKPFHLHRTLHTGESRDF